MDNDSKAKNRRRLRRQLRAISNNLPVFGGTLTVLLRRDMFWLRVPVAFLLMVGGVFGFLPILGLWMFPLGLCLLAIDLPFLRPAVVRIVIVGRRRMRLWLRTLRRRTTG